MSMLLDERRESILKIVENKGFVSLVDLPFEGIWSILTESVRSGGPEVGLLIVENP